MVQYQPTPDARESLAVEGKTADGRAGLVKPVWYRFFSDVWRRAESHATTLDSHTTSIATLTARKERVLLDTKVAAASATIDFTTGLSSTYDRYEIELLTVIPATDGADLLMRIGTGVGPTWQAGAATYGWSHWAVSFGVGAGEGATATAITLNWDTQGVGNSAGESCNGIIDFFNPDATLYPQFYTRIWHVGADGVPYTTTGHGYYGSATAITGVRFLFSAGNITSGTFRLWGWPT